MNRSAQTHTLKQVDLSTVEKFPVSTNVWKSFTSLANKPETILHRNGLVMTLIIAQDYMSQCNISFINWEWSLEEERGRDYPD